MRRPLLLAPAGLPDAHGRVASWWRRTAVVAALATALTGTLVAAADQLGGPELDPPAAPVAGEAQAPDGEVPSRAVGAPIGAAMQAAVPTAGPGYRITSADGGVFTHGWFGFAGSAAGETGSPMVGLAHTPDGEGYWLSSADGGVFAFGTAEFLGSAAGDSTERVVDIAATPTGLGYWLVAADGGVFAFGDAGYFGAGPEVGMPSRVVSLAPTATGLGYWLVSSDGGVFTFGDAGFLGSLGDTAVNGRIIDLVPTADDGGYYLVGADGGIFTFGSAPFHGAAIDERLTKPIVDMALLPDGSGYWLLSGDGGVYSYGAAPFLGAPASERTGRPFTAIAAGVGRQTPPPLAAEPATAELASPPATVASTGEPAPEVSAASATVTAAAAGGDTSRAAAKERVRDDARDHAREKARGAWAPRRLDRQFGWDISYPQCDGPYPSAPSAYAIIGVNGGRAFRHNRCLADQWRWARQRGAAGIYLNVNFPRSEDELARGATSDRQPACGPDALGCVAYNFGLNGVRDSLDYARSQGVEAPFAWLDVEHLNYWTRNQPLNAIVLRGAIDAVREAGLEPGIYSTPFQFQKLMGDEQPGLPVWTAGANGLPAVAEYCVTRGFGGGPVALVQLLPGQYDPNIACPGSGSMARYFNLG